MNDLSIFHLTGDGAVIKEFIASDDDFPAAFNLIGVCAFNAGVIVMAFGIEESHPHILLRGHRERCMRFKCLFEGSFLHHAARTRKPPVNLNLDLDLLDIADESHLMNAGTYTIIQPTKDGKQVMPYDYLWGTGSMYFRPPTHIPIWCYDAAGVFHQPERADRVGARRLRAICCSRMPIPDHWLICNGLILPDNYVDVAAFERIYRTANCYRTFLTSSRAQQQTVQQRIAAARGVSFDDLEARRLCGDGCQRMFGFKDVRRLNALQRIQLAQQLWRTHHLSRRQLATIVRLPYEEICKYT